MFSSLSWYNGSLVSGSYKTWPGLAGSINISRLILVPYSFTQCTINGHSPFLSEEWKSLSAFSKRCTSFSIDQFPKIESFLTFFTSCCSVGMSLPPPLACQDKKRVGCRCARIRARGARPGGVHRRHFFFFPPVGSGGAPPRRN